MMESREMAKRLPPAFAALPLLLLCLTLACAIDFCHRRILAIQFKPGAPHANGVMPVPDAAVLKYMSLGYDQLLSDCWWLAFIQYYGDTGARAVDHYRLAYRYLNLITQLDPKFRQPYWFSAFAIGSDMRNPALSDAIIKRGIQSNQDSWYLPFIAGVNQYLFAHDEAAAARYYRMAAKYPEAPGWLGRQADILEARMPSLLKEINTWTAAYLSTDDKLVRRECKRKLIELWLDVYKNVPGYGAKRRAAAELKLLGLDLPLENSK